jgi:RNA polymerase sigma-70 factor (ECF subfamily)
MSNVVHDPGNHSAGRAAPPGQAGSTSDSLLERLKEGQAEGWRLLLDLYAPLVLWWCARQRLRPQEAEEVAQEVFLTVTTRVAGFTRQRQRGSFRAWLRAITRNQLAAYCRRRGRQPQALGGRAGEELLAGVPADPAGAPDPADDAAERGILRRRVLDLLRGEFDARTWDAVWQTVVEGRRPADVAADLGMSVNAVYIARSRVLGRGRELLQDLGE